MLLVLDVVVIGHQCSWYLESWAFTRMRRPSDGHVAKSQAKKMNSFKLSPRAAEEKATRELRQQTATARRCCFVITCERTRADSPPPSPIIRPDDDANSASQPTLELSRAEFGGARVRLMMPRRRK